MNFESAKVSSISSSLSINNISDWNMATSSEEVLESVNSDKLVNPGEAGKVLAPIADHEDIEMSDCNGGNVKETGVGNVLASKETEGVDMDGEEATAEQSENLLNNSHTLLSNGVTPSAHKEAVGASDGGGGGEQEEEPGVEEHGEEEETADGESQEDEEDVEGTLQKKTSEGVLKDASNTATEVAAEMLFWSNMKICFELLPNRHY